MVFLFCPIGFAKRRRGAIAYRREGRFEELQAGAVFFFFGIRHSCQGSVCCVLVNLFRLKSATCSEL